MKVVKKGYSTGSIFLVFGLLVLGAYGFLFNRTIFLSGKEYIVAPFIYAQSTLAAKVNGWKDSVVEKNNLLQERNLYRKRAQELQGQLIALKAQNVFIQETSELIDYKNKYQITHAKLAKILLKNCNTEEHSCLIDVGSDDGVTVDSAVVYKNCLLGKVVEVHASYSKILLITDRHCKVAVFCSTTKTPGIYEGSCSNNTACLNHVSHMQKLEVGDTLLSAGEGLIFPYGFGVGTIESFEQKGIQYEVKVKPLLDTVQIDYCYVLLAK
jgi:rod shape-determining protein MreC